MIAHWMENTTCVKPPTSQTFYSSHGRSQRRNGGRSVATLGPMPAGQSLKA